MEAQRSADGFTWQIERVIASCASASDLLPTGSRREDAELGEISQPGGQLFQVRSAFNSGRKSERKQTAVVCCLRRFVPICGLMHRSKNAR